MNDKRVEVLEKAPVKTAVRVMALPAIIGLMVMGIYNMVDTMFVAWIGTEATGATQVVMPIMMLASTIGLSFGIGGGNYISRLLGRKEMKRAEQTAITAFITALIFGVIFVIVNFVFMESILGFFGADESVMALSKSYGTYIIWGSMFTVGNMVMNNLLRSEGSAKLSMIGMAIGSLLNIALDPLFIFVFGWGIAGAAIATTLSQAVTFVVLISSYLRKKTVIKLHISYLRMKWDIYREIFVVGFPTFCKQLLVSIAMALLNQAAIKTGGPDLLAAIGIIMKTAYIPMYAIFGLGQGFQPVAGYNIGAGNRERVMESFRYTIIVSMVITFISAAILSLLGSEIMSIFKASEPVTKIGISGLRYYSISLVLLGFINTITVFYQALGKGRASMILSVSRQGIFFMPLVMFLPNLMGIEGVILVQPIADIFTFILSILMIMTFMKSGKLGLAMEKHQVIKEAA